MTTVFIFAIAVLWLLLMAVQEQGGEMLVNPIKGLMFGALYHNDKDEDYSYHTIQIFFACIGLTFIWNTNV